MSAVRFFTFDGQIITSLQSAWSLLASSGSHHKTKLVTA